MSGLRPCCRHPRSTRFTIRASQLASYGVERASVNYHDASNFRLFAEAFIYGTTYDTYVQTYRHGLRFTRLCGARSGSPQLHYIMPYTTCK